MILTAENVPELCAQSSKVRLVGGNGGWGESHQVLKRVLFADGLRSEMGISSSVVRDDLRSYSAQVCAASDTFPAEEGLVKAFPFLHPYRSSKLFSAFFFDVESAKKKAKQKRNAGKWISPLRRRPRLRLWKPQTFEKVWSKLLNQVKLTPLN